MADLESCYFCGAGPDAALSEYGVVPAAFEPTDDQQRSVVLCPSCRDKLIAVMDATVAASDVESTDARPSAAANPDADVTGAVDDIIDATVTETTPDPPQSDSEATEETASSTGSGETPRPPDPADPAGPTDSISTTDEPSRPDSPTDAPNQSTGDPTAPTETSSEQDRRELVERDQREPDGQTRREPDGREGRESDEQTRSEPDERDLEEDVGISRENRQGVSFSSASDSEDDISTSSVDDDEPVQRETGAGSVGAPGSVPKGSPDGADGRGGGGSENYRQVLRLLQNREFPIQRAEIVDVAASAYDLTPTEVESAIDTIVTKGLLQEDDGVLKRD